MRNWLALAVVAAFLFMAGCATQPNANTYYADCCVQNATSPSECNGWANSDCTNADGYNVCYNLSNSPKTVMVPICPQFEAGECVLGDCKAMVCSKARKQVSVPPTQSDIDPETIPPGVASMRAGGLIGKYCRFTPLDAKTTKLLKQEKDAIVNTLRLGIAGDFSDYDRARFYFPISDYWGAQLSRDAVVDRFVRYLGSTTVGTCTLTCPTPPGITHFGFTQAQCDAEAALNPTCTKNWQLDGASPPLCEPRDASDVVTTTQNVKWTCALTPGTPTSNDVDYVIDDYGGSDELAQLACMFECRGTLTCSQNQDLIVGNANISAPTATGANAIPPRQFVDIGRLDQFGSPWSGNAGTGYGQQLYSSYKGTPSRFTDPAQPGPLGGYDYECSSGKDCYSGICNKDIYQRTACLLPNGQTGPNGEILYDSTDCQCAMVNACEQWFTNCGLNPPDSPASDGCTLAKDICNAAKLGGQGKMILCHHDPTWKGRENWGRLAAPLIPPYSPTQDFMSIDYSYYKDNQNIVERVFYSTVRPSMQYDDWETKWDDYFRLNYPGEMVKFARYMPLGGSTAISSGLPASACTPPACACINSASGEIEGFSDQSLCENNGHLWKKRYGGGDSPSNVDHGYQNYLTAFRNAPEWQAITYGTTDSPFSTTNAVEGGAFVFASPGYRSNDYVAPGRNVPQDTTLWTGTKEELMATFPIIAACNIPESDIVEVDPMTYGYYGTPRAYAPGAIDDGRGGKISPKKTWRIRSFGDCAIDQNGWPIVRTYGVCEPRTFLTMAYQKVKDSYATGFPAAYSQFTDHEYSSAGYCPKADCTLEGNMCKCPSYYGANLVPKFGDQAVHTNPELSYLADSVARLQADSVIPVLDIKDYSYDNVPPASFPAPIFYDINTCKYDTGSAGRNVCVEKATQAIQPDLANCQNNDPDYEYMQVCTMPDVPDQLLYFLSQNHSAAILLVDSLDAANAARAKMRVANVSQQCPDCMIALDYPAAIPYSQLANLQSDIDALNATLEAVTGVGDGWTVADKINGLTYTSGLSSVDIIILRIDLGHTATAPDFALAINRTAELARHVLHHTGWATVVILQQDAYGLAGDFEKAGLYYNLTLKGSALAKAGVVGVLLPPLNVTGGAGTPLGDQYPRMVEINRGDTYQNAPVFCAAQEGTQGFVRPKIISATIRIPTKDACACSPCTKEESELGLCDATCLDGKLCGDGSKSVGVKCAPLCSRAAQCTQCSTLTCVRAQSTPSGLDFSQLLGITVNDNDVYGPQIGSMATPCCIQANISTTPGLTIRANVTYKTEFRVQTSTDLAIFPKFANNETDCSYLPEAADTSGAVCMPNQPLIDDSVDICVGP